MIDPLPVIFATVTAFNGCTSAVQSTKGLIDSISGAPNAISRIARDVNAFGTDLEQKKRMIQGNRRLERSSECRHALNALLPALEQCQPCLKELRDDIEKYTVSEGVGMTRKVTFAFQDASINNKVIGLNTCKETLHGAWDTYTHCMDNYDFQRLHRALKKKNHIKSNAKTSSSREEKSATRLYSSRRSLIGHQHSDCDEDFAAIDEPDSMVFGGKHKPKTVTDLFATSIRLVSSTKTFIDSVQNAPGSIFQVFKDVRAVRITLGNFRIVSTTEKP